MPRPWKVRQGPHEMYFRGQYTQLDSVRLNEVVGTRCSCNARFLLRLSFTAQATHPFEPCSTVTAWFGFSNTVGNRQSDLAVILTVKENRWRLALSSPGTGSIFAPRCSVMIVLTVTQGFNSVDAPFPHGSGLLSEPGGALHIGRTSSCRSGRLRGENDHRCIPGKPCRVGRSSCHVDLRHA